MQNLTLADQYSLKLCLERLANVRRNGYHNDIYTLRVDSHNTLVLLLDNHLFVIKTDVGAQYRNILTNQRIVRHIVI